jgi:hypothetical protein
VRDSLAVQRDFGSRHIRNPNFEILNPKPKPNGKQQDRKQEQILSLLWVPLISSLLFPDLLFVSDLGFRDSGFWPPRA